MFEKLERITYQPGDKIFQEGDEGNCGLAKHHVGIKPSVSKTSPVQYITSRHGFFSMAYQIYNSTCHVFAVVFCK